MDKSIKHWRSLRIASPGKVILVNTIAMAPLWHIAGQLQIHKNQIKITEKTAFNFIWGSDIEPIKRRTNQQPRRNGGLGVQNIKKKQEAIWTKQILKIIEDPNSPKNILIRMRLTPSVKWDNLMSARGATRTARINIPHDKYRYLNNWIKESNFNNISTNQSLKGIY